MAIGTSRPPCEPKPSFPAQVTAAVRGGWVTVIDLGVGTTLSRWFPDEEHARRYPEQVIEWLQQNRGAQL
jgi:hypothetical protein